MYASPNPLAYFVKSSGLSLDRQGSPNFIALEPFGMFCGSNFIY